MTAYLLAKWLHVIGAAVLFGTGAGIAFFMLLAHRTRRADLIAHVAATVVIADALFTAAAVIAQPLTGLWLISETGWRLADGWIVLSLALYVLAGLLWLPVVWIQIRLRDLAREAAATGAPLNQRYFTLFRIWFWSGFPAFGAVAAIYWLMLAKPPIRLW